MKDAIVPPEKELVYGTPIEESLVFIPRARAEALSAIWRAIDTARTWSDFRAKMPQQVYEEIMGQAFDEDDEPRPDDGAAFDYDLVSFDNNWPSNPWDDMRDFLPEGVCALADPMHLGDFFTINSRNEVEALAVLRADGSHAERDDDLVKKACGHWNGVHFWDP